MYDQIWTLYIQIRNVYMQMSLHFCLYSEYYTTNQLGTHGTGAATQTADSHTNRRFP